MAIDYVIRWTDDALKEPFKLSAQSTNITATSLILSGKGSGNWGESVQQNMIRLLENFCSDDIPPPQPTVGQLWFNKAQNILKCYWNGKWNDVGYQRIDSHNPPAGPNFSGDLWYDLVNDVLKVFNGANWDKVYQGGLPRPDTIPIPTHTTPTPTVTPTPTISPTPVTPTPTPTVTPTPTPTVTPTPTPTVTPTPTPTVTPTPVVPVPTPVSPPVTPPTSPTGFQPLPYGKSGSWELAFHDEFDANGINTMNWDDKHWSQIFTNQPLNYSVSSGTLKIWPTSDFTPRYLSTYNKWNFNYGYFEIEAKMPVGQGLMPTFYLTSREENHPLINIASVFCSGGVPLYNTETKHPTNYRFEVWNIGAGGISSQIKLTETMTAMYPQGSTDLSAGYHKYGCYWDSTGIEFYFDGHFLGKLNDDGTGYYNRNLYITIGLLYGNSSGLPDETTPIGSGNSMDVNYVRVWRPQTLPPAGVGNTTPNGWPGPYNPNNYPDLAGSGYELSFRDDFQGPLSGSLWNDHIWYEPGNPTINYGTSNGTLKLWPQRDVYGNFINRTIDMDGKYYFEHGFIEAKAKMPRGKGLWPAIWLYTHEIDPYGAAIRPEINLLEAFTSGGIDNGWSDANNQPMSYQVMVIEGPNNYDVAGQKLIPVNNLSTQFHTYGVKWEPTKITFYCDGNLVYSCNATLTNRMYLLITLWMANAGQGGTPDSTTPLGVNNSFEIEYIRYWKFL